MKKMAIIVSAVASLALVACGGEDEARGTEPRATTAGAEQPTMRGGMGPHRGRMGMHHGQARTSGGPMAEGPAQQGGAEMEERCPMLISSAQIRAEDIEDGVALVFTTIDASKVEDLRERVRAFAAHHQAMARRGAGGPMAQAASSANVIDVVGGARLELRADDPSQLSALRQHAQVRATRMGQGQCPMMEGAQVAG